MRTIAIVAHRAPNVPLHPATWVVDTRTGPRELPLNLDGYASLLVDDGWPFWINLRIPGAATYELGFNGKADPAKPNVAIRETGNVELVVGDLGHPLDPSYQVQCPPAVADLPALSIAGKTILAGGQPFLWVGSTFFRGFWYDLANQLPDATLASYQAAGFNVLREFLNWENSGFRPADFGERFYAMLPLHAHRLAAWGFYVEYVVFAPKPLCPEFDGNTSAQVAFASRVYAACAGCSNIAWELGNEAMLDSHLAINEIPAPPPPAIWASGVYDVPNGRRGTHLTFHGRRDFKGPLEYFPCEARNDGWPALNDEGPRCPDQPTADPSYWWECGAAARAGNGGTMHHVLGRDTCDPLSGETLVAARAFTAGARGQARPEYP